MLLLLLDEMFCVCLLGLLDIKCSSIEYFITVFCLDDLSIAKSWLLKSPTIIVFLSLSALKPINTFLIYLDIPLISAILVQLLHPPDELMPLLLISQYHLILTTCSNFPGYFIT